MNGPHRRLLWLRIVVISLHPHPSLSHFVGEGKDGSRLTKPSYLICYRIPAAFNSCSSFATASFGIGSVSHLGKRFTSKPRMRKTSRRGTRPYFRNSAATRRAAVSTFFCASTAFV